MKTLPTILPLLWLLCVGIISRSDAAPAELSATITFDKRAYTTNDTILIDIAVRIPDSFHLYSNPLGPGVGKPFSLKLPALPEIQWTKAFKLKPKRFDPAFGDYVFAYSDSAHFFAQGLLRGAVPPTSISISGLICNTSCIPVSKDVPLIIPFVATGSLKMVASFADNVSLATLFATALSMDFVETNSAPPLSSNEMSMGAITLKPSPQSPQNTLPNYIPRAQASTMTLGLALLFAFIAGIILNAMPCVLPVIGIKIIALANNAQDNLKKKLLFGGVFSLGVLSVFMALATLAAFAGLSWGAQFQNPWFLISLISLMVIFGLGMFDVYIMGVPSLIGKASTHNRETLLGYFFKGMLTTLLATPCSGPFLGGTLAWTLTQPALTTYLVFTMLGIGMAFPYLLLSLFSPLARLIPRPGPWMEYFKYSLGFALFAFAAYLLLGLPGQLGAQTAGFAVFLCAAVILYNKIAPFGSNRLRKLIAGLVGTLILAAGLQLWFGLFTTLSVGATAQSRNSQLVWETYSPEKLLWAQRENRSVIVDFTASWCMNCQYNSAVVLSDKTIVDLINTKNVLPLLADLTTSNAPAESLMTMLGSRSIPFLAIFSAKDSLHPTVMRDILTVKKVQAALSQIP